MEIKIYMLKGGDQVRINGKFYEVFDGPCRGVRGSWNIKIVVGNEVRRVGSYASLDAVVTIK